MKRVKRNKGNSFCADCHTTAKVLTEFQFLFIPFIAIIVDFFFFSIGDASLLFPHCGQKICFTELNISSITSPLSSALKCTAKSIDCKMAQVSSLSIHQLTRTEQSPDRRVNNRSDIQTLSGSLTQSQKPAIDVYSEPD
jgi:hypothetical protein